MSSFRGLERFVQFLRWDEAAVENAVTMPWSNGQVEGHVKNNLKALKRQMYGSAGAPSYCALAYYPRPHRKLALNLREILLKYSAIPVVIDDDDCHPSNLNTDSCF